MEAIDRPDERRIYKIDGIIKKINSLIWIWYLMAENEFHFGFEVVFCRFNLISCIAHLFRELTHIAATAAIKGIRKIGFASWKYANFPIYLKIDVG